MITKKKKFLSHKEKLVNLRKLFKKLKSNFFSRKFSSPYFKIFYSLKGVLPSFNLRLSVNISSNNIFLNLSKILNAKVLKNASSGSFKVKVTKKRLKQTVCVVLQKFLNKIKPVIHRRNLLIILTSPQFLRKKVLKLFRDSFMRRNIFIKINPLKCFNGCRPKKRKRKKRVLLKVFKVV